MTAVSSIFVFIWSNMRMYLMIWHYLMGWLILLIYLYIFQFGIFAAEYKNCNKWRRSARVLNRSGEKRHLSKWNCWPRRTFKHRSEYSSSTFCTLFEQLLTHWCDYSKCECEERREGLARRNGLSVGESLSRVETLYNNRCNSCFRHHSEHTASFWVVILICSIFCYANVVLWCFLVMVFEDCKYQKLSMKVWWAVCCDCDCVKAPPPPPPPRVFSSCHLLFWCNVQQLCGLKNMAAAAVSGNVSP